MNYKIIKNREYLYLYAYQFGDEFPFSFHFISFLFFRCAGEREIGPPVEFAVSVNPPNRSSAPGLQRDGA